ncbi:Delta(24)-sterol C-methyltransferase [Collariella sp. IMI 366227]|nr:Delta(24)-sterol C-methyltransferase [Collariella sp. IMI 366227]
MASHFPNTVYEEVLRRYLSHFTRDPTNPSKLDVEAVSWATDEERRERQKKYCEIGSDYYDVVSPLYEMGWGQQFHYTPLTPGLSLSESMIQYEKTFAEIARLDKGMLVLDLGCGIGGPARTIASAVGCNIVGITNSAWHVERGTALTQNAGLSHLISFVQGDFLKLPFPDESFDAAYSVESLCYSPDPAAVYSEIKRVLKPGAPFTFHDFAMTEKFDEGDPEQRKVRNWIEFGNGITGMPWVPEMRAGVKKAGFQLLKEEDMAFRSAPAPWHYGPAGDIFWAWRTPGWPDFWKVFKMWPVFRGLAQKYLQLLILFGRIPAEISTGMDFMWYCTKGVAIGAKMDIFTPMYVFVCRKPVEGKAS